MLYAFTENFVLPISHDEVVHGKGSLISKMPGDEWQRFANVRAFLAYMFGASRQEAAVHGHRVRPDLGMESRRRACRWWLLQFPVHHKLQTMVRELNRLYRARAGAVRGG